MSGTIESLDRAKSMALANSDLFPEVFKTVLPIVYNNDLVLQKWCISFLVESFANKEGKLPRLLLKELSVQVLDPVQVLLKVKDAMVVQKTIHLMVLTYELIFLNVLENGSTHESKLNWQKISDIKQEVIRNFQTSTPLLPLNKQVDQWRSIACKLQTIQFIGKIAEIQLPVPPRDPRMRRHAAATASTVDVSISMIPPNHPILKKSLEAEGLALLDMLFNYINDEALVISSLFSAVELTIVKLLKKRPDHVYNKLTNLVMVYESYLKKHSKFEEDHVKIKLISRFNDRFNKVLIGFLINKKIVKDSNLQLKMSKKFSHVMVRNDILKKRGILNDSEDDVVGTGPNKRRKLDQQILNTDEQFYNSSPISKDRNYSSLYSLINAKDKATEIDLSSISQDVLTNMVVIALKKAERSKLIEGLTIISERYRELLTRPGVGVKGEDQNQLRISGDGIGEDGGEDDEFVGDEIDDLNGVTYDLPIPKRMTLEEKKKHIQRIIGNFIKLAGTEVRTAGPNLGDKLESSQSDLTKVAIPSWNKESWLVVLTRLASRGLSSGEVEKVDKDAEEQKEDAQLSDIIREEMYKYFSEDIRSRIDVCIEWLNEEWYSEIIKNESRAQSVEMTKEEIESTPIYLKWAGKVLDTVILFLESSDRKLFIRLMSDLPFLNKELVWKIKSLCLDPTRFKIGFQSLQFLAIYRPPLKQAAIALLKELQAEAKEKEDATGDFTNEVVSLLRKLSPEDVQG